MRNIKDQAFKDKDNVKGNTSMVKDVTYNLFANCDISAKDKWTHKYNCKNNNNNIKQQTLNLGKPAPEMYNSHSTFSITVTASVAPIPTPPPTPTPIIVLHYYDPQHHSVYINVQIIRILVHNLSMFSWAYLSPDEKR